jgi:hypothetical protein
MGVRIFFWLFIIAFVVALWCLGWPGAAFTIGATFWIWAAVFMALLDILTGGYRLKAVTVQRSRKQEQ